MIDSAQATNAGTYRVRVSNGVGLIVSSNAVLTVRIPPSITKPPASLVVTQGTSARFKVAAVGDPPLSYQWFFSGAKIRGAISNSYVVSNARMTNAGDYHAVVLNSYGSATSAVAILTVLSASRAATQQLQLSWDRAASGPASLRIWAEPGIPYTLESSTDFTTWRPVFTNASGVAGVYFEVPAGAGSFQFIRGRRWP